MSDKVSCSNCGAKVIDFHYYKPYFYCKQCYEEGTF